MDKQERLILARAGWTILRPQFDTRKSCWKIVKHTRSGGWARFGGSWFNTREETIKKIDWLIEQYPEQYKKED